jgi:hypothetical protein
MISSTSVFDNALTLSKVFRGWGSDKVQCVPARLNQFFRDVQVLSYICIRIRSSMGGISDMKSGTLSANINAIVANVDPVTFRS